MNAEPERHRGFAIRDVIAFSRKYDPRGKCFGGWPDNILEIYIRFHQQNGSLCLVEQDGVLVGMGVGYRINENDLDRHWQPFNPEGDSFYLSDIICSERWATATCINEFAERVPDWRRLRVLALRHGKRREFSQQLIERIFSDSQRHSCKREAVRKQTSDSEYKDAEALASGGVCGGGVPDCRATG